MEARAFVGTLRERPNETFLVFARDELDAERFVTATLGAPASCEELRTPEGLAMSFARRGDALTPERLAPNLALEAAAAAPMSAAP